MMKSVKMKMVDRHASHGNRVSACVCAKTRLSRNVSLIPRFVCLSVCLCGYFMRGLVCLFFSGVCVCLSISFFRFFFHLLSFLFSLQCAFFIFSFSFILFALFFFQLFFFWSFCFLSFPLFCLLIFSLKSFPLLFSFIIFSPTSHILLSYSLLPLTSLFLFFRLILFPSSLSFLLLFHHSISSIFFSPSLPFFSLSFTFSYLFVFRIMNFSKRFPCCL